MINQLLGQLHPESLLLGIGTGLAVASIIGLVLHNRQQRQRLVLSLRLDQAGRNIRRLEDENRQLHTEKRALHEQCQQLGNRNAGLEETVSLARQQLQQQQTFIRETRRQLEQDFRVLADQVLTEKGARLTREHESGLKALLYPVRDQLQEFRKKVEDVYDRESRDRVSMIREIEHLKILNERISADAVRLTEALRGSNKLQGQWGEMLLEKLLEDSGLRKGSEFDTQVTLTTKSGRTRQPDVIIYLPGERQVIIDAKVSLKAYVQAHQAKEGEEQQQFMRQHAESIKRHIAGLSKKRYQDLLELGNPDFVLLFIPIEGAFQAAVSRDPELLADAMRKKVMLSSPSSLLAILRAIHHLWRLDEQNRNGLAIAKQAGNLYDKFVGFAEAFEEVGQRLEQTRHAWQTARKRLATGHGNLINRTRILKELGVEPGKELPASLRREETEAPPSAPEEVLPVSEKKPGTS